MLLEANIFTVLLFVIALVSSILTLRVALKSIRRSYDVFQKGETPSGKKHWHNLKGKEATRFARGELIAGVILLIWAGVFLWLTATWGVSIINTVINNFN